MHTNSLLIGLWLIPVQKSIYRLLLIDFFTSLLYSCLGTSLERPAVVVSQQCSGPFSIVSVFHSCDIFTKTFIMFKTNYHTTVFREEIQVGTKEVDLKIHKNSLFTLCFAESRECFMQVSESWRSPIHGFHRVLHQV